MGWTITLEADRDIKEKDIERIVKELPEDLEGWGSESKQSWGWPAATDIYLPEGKSLTIHGSYTQSGHKAKPMAEHLKFELENLSYKIQVDYDDF